MKFSEVINDLKQNFLLNENHIDFDI